MCLSECLVISLYFIYFDFLGEVANYGVLNPKAEISKFTYGAFSFVLCSKHILPKRGTQNLNTPVKYIFTTPFTPVITHWKLTLKRSLHPLPRPSLSPFYEFRVQAALVYFAITKQTRNRHMYIHEHYHTSSALLVSAIMPGVLTINKPY